MMTTHDAAPGLQVIRLDLGHLRRFSPDRVLMIVGISGL